MNRIKLTLTIALLSLMLTACGGGDPTPAATAQPTAAPTPTDIPPTEEAEAETSEAAVEEIMTTTVSFADMDVCALVPRETVESIIGALSEEPRLGNVLGVDGMVQTRACNYRVDGGPRVHVGIADLTERNEELFDKFVRGIEIEGLGSRAVETVNGATVVKVDGRAILQGGGLRGEPMHNLIQAIIAALP